MTKYSLKNRGVVYFFYFLVVLLGISAINTIPKQESPEFPSWGAVIITRFTGASPQKVEELVTDKIEEKMKEVEQLDDITSTSKTGISYVFLNVKQSIFETKPAFDKVREKLDDLAGQLPDGVNTPYLNTDFGKTKSFVIAITGDGFENRELVDIAEDVKQDLGLMKYVSRVDLFGEQDQRIFLEFSNTKLSELGMTIDQIKSILIDQNVLSPGGDIKVGPQSIRIQATGEFKSLEDIKKTTITIPGQKNQFFIQDLFKVHREYIDPRASEMRYMGKDAVAVVVEMENGGQILELGEMVKSYLKEKEQQQYLGIHFDIMNYQPRWVASKISDFVTNLWQAVLVVAISMLLLLGWREGVIISTLIPFSFLMAIIMMTFADIQIHQISIAALIIALGMLVDNGIVMTENITLYVKQGLSKKDAAIKSARELTIPLLTATATTISAFLPIATAKSAVGLFCNSIAWVVGFVLLSSFFVSMTLIPLLCTKLLKVEKGEKNTGKSILSIFSKKKKENAEEEQVKKENAISKFYAKFLHLCLKYKYITIVAAFAILFGVGQLAGKVGFVFFPPSDRAQFTIDLLLPEGTDYRETKGEVLRAEKYLLKNYKNEIRNMAIYIGEGGPRFAGFASEQQANNYAQVVINNHDFSETEQMVRELQDYFNANYTDTKATVKLLDSGPTIGAPIQIEVHGKDMEKLYAYSEKIEAILRDTKGTRDVKNNWGDQIPRLTIEINQDQARRVGVSTSNLSKVLDNNFNGLKTTEYREGDKTIPIIMRSQEKERTSLRSLQSINLQTSQGTTVPLLQVAKVKLDWEAGKILRVNRVKTITVKAYNIAGFNTTALLEQAKQEIKKIEFEPGYGIRYKGEQDASQDANDSIASQIPMAFAILVMILVAQFGNVRKMIIILMTIPLSFIGIILGLLGTGYPFGFMALLGVISLAGIVVNNAILLIEQIQADLDEGILPTEAIINAGLRRSFPIMLTTITTASGLFPLAIAGGMWGPMAVTIMGGLIVSTILTLIVIPTLYSILFRVKYQPITAG